MKQFIARIALTIITVQNAGCSHSLSVRNERGGSHSRISPFRGTITARILSALIPSLALLFPGIGRTGNYTNFNVAIYIPVGVVQHFENLENLTNDWDRINRQLKVDKVYIEVQRNRTLATDEELETVKKFFMDRGVNVAGGMALSDGGSGQFRSFCYTDPDDRQFIKARPNWPRGISMKSSRTISSSSPPKTTRTSPPGERIPGRSSGSSSWTRPRKISSSNRPAP